MRKTLEWAEHAIRLTSAIPFALILGLFVFPSKPLLGQNLDNARLLPSGGQRGTAVTIELPGKFEKWPIAFWADPPQIQWSASETPGKIVATIPPDAKLGLHHVRLHSSESISPLLRFLVGDLPEVTEVEPNDSFSKPQVCDALPITINGVLQKSGDVDHYQFKGTRGQRFTATVDANRTLKSPMDACLELVDDRGNILAQNLDALGLDPRLQFVCPKDGIYVLRIYAFPETPDSTIGYAGGEKFLYRIRCSVGESDDLDNEFRADAIPIAEPSSRETPSTVPIKSEPVPQYFFGEFEAQSDEDVILWETKEAGFWKVASHAQSMGSSADLVLEILDANLKTIAKQGDSGEIKDPALAAQMKTPGAYRIAVRDLHGRFGQNFRYRLEIENETPIIRGTVASDILTGKVDKPVEIEVTLERLHGCAEEGTIRVLGLPPEYTCEPASSKLKEESEKKVVLKVAAIPKPDGTPQVPWSGPITIEIETAGRPIKPPATATNTKLPWLWLKIAP